MDSKGNTIAAYTGNFMNDQKEGKGSYKSGDKEYSGIFTNGMLKGNKFLVHKNGIIYMGIFNNNKEKGTCVFILPTGEYYEGNIDDD